MAFPRRLFPNSRPVVPYAGFSNSVAAFQFVLLTCSTILMGQQLEYPTTQAAVFAQLRKASHCDAQALVNKASASSHAAMGRAYALTSGGRTASSRRNSATLTSSTPVGQGRPQQRTRAGGPASRRTRTSLSQPPPTATTAPASRQAGPCFGHMLAHFGGSPHQCRPPPGGSCKYNHDFSSFHKADLVAAAAKLSGPYAPTTVAAVAALP